jgi:hypothetical protein
MSDILSLSDILVAVTYFLFGMGCSFSTRNPSVKAIDHAVLLFLWPYFLGYMVFRYLEKALQ